jgi:putative peptidoglycan lipid II flippase
MIDQNKTNTRNSVVKSSFIVGGMTFISRVSGFIRDIIFANVFGASSNTDAFFIAFKIPNFFRRLFAEGAFIQSFVPILNEYKTIKPLEVKKLISYIQGNLGLVLFFITLLGIIFSENIINIFAPGFSDNDIRFSLASDMLKITFPYLFFISLTAMYAGIFNTYDKFLLPSITPVLLNISLITATIYSSHLSYTPIMSLAYGVLIAGIIQYFIQLPFLYKMKLLVLPRINFSFPGVNKVLKLMLPAIIGTAVVQINLIVDSIVASMLAPGSIDMLVEFPLGVFGIAIATVILPLLSEKYSSKDMNGFKNTLSNSLKIVLIFSLPAMFGLILLSDHIIMSLFQYGSFTNDDTNMSSLSLVAYSLGLPAFILMKVLLTGFFSRQDTKTPVKYGLIAVAFNIFMNMIVVLYYLSNPFDGAHAMLALATSLSAWIQVTLLYLKLKKEEVVYNSNIFNKEPFISIISCIIMLVILGSIIIQPIELAKNEYYIRGLLLGLYIIMGGLVYIISMYILGYKFKKSLL